MLCYNRVALAVMQTVPAWLSAHSDAFVLSPSSHAPRRRIFCSTVSGDVARYSNFFTWPDFSAAAEAIRLSSNVAVSGPCTRQSASTLDRTEMGMESQQRRSCPHDCS